MSCFNFAPLQRLARPRFSWRGGYKDDKFISRTLSNVSVNSIFLKFGKSHCVSLHREIFVPNIIHKHGFLHCSMLSVLSTLFVQIFLKFSLEIHFFFLYRSSYMYHGRASLIPLLDFYYFRIFVCDVSSLKN